MYLISPEQASWIHDRILSFSGGAAGIRDKGRLDSVINHAAGSYYPGLSEKAAHVLFGIAKFHPFVDGNKRAAAACAAEVLLGNGCEIHDVDAKLEDLAYSVADGSIDERGVVDHIGRIIKTAKA